VQRIPIGDSLARMSNRLASVVHKTSKLPSALRVRALTAILGNVLPFVGTARVVIEEMTESRVVATLKNRRRVQNHIGGVHAAAMTLVAETATGMVVGMNAPDDRALVVKTLSLTFKKRAQGDLRAFAELTDEQRQSIVSAERGEVDVRVRLIDEKGVEPLEATMIWAWTPKRK
jgi:acyl-coenzyme A thioesterase PaaI-like protein